MQLFSSVENTGARYGLMAGSAAVLIFAVAYLVQKSWVVNPVIYYGSLVAYLLAMYLAIRVDAKKRKAYLSWREALKVGFTVYVVANLLFWVAYYLLNQLDPSLIEIQRDMMREWYPRIIPKDQLAESLRELENADLSLTFRRASLGFARGAMAGFIWAIVFATLHRRDAQKF
jgi:hypothetical protein